jgi:hypothetical protein
MSNHSISGVRSDVNTAFNFPAMTGRRILLFVVLNAADEMRILRTGQHTPVRLNHRNIQTEIILHDVSATRYGSLGLWVLF